MADLEIVFALVSFLVRAQTRCHKRLAGNQRTPPNMCHPKVWPRRPWNEWMLCSNIINMRPRMSPFPHLERLASKLHCCVKHRPAHPTPPPPWRRPLSVTNQQHPNATRTPHECVCGKMNRLVWSTSLAISLARELWFPRCGLHFRSRGNHAFPLCSFPNGQV